MGILMWNGEEYVGDGASVGHFTKEDAESLAEQEGLIAVFPQERELLLDMDLVPTPDKRALDSLSMNGYSLVSMLTTTSKSGHWHVYIQLGETLALQERVTLQAILGSDPIREMISLKRCNLGSLCPTMLLETRKEYLKVVRWREGLA